MSQPTPPLSSPPVTDPTSTGDDLAPVVPGAPKVKQTERPHPLTPFIRGWIILLAIILSFGRELVPNGSDDEQFTTADLVWLLPAIGGVVVIAAAAGFLSWYFTRFVIDDEELRIETGAVFKNSKRVSFERLQSIDIIQPLAARMFGLAELRFEVGAGDSTIKLRYLSRSNASQLRDYLLARAHGEQATRGESVEGPVASAVTDRTVIERPIVTVTPQRLVASFMLSSEWLVTVIITVVVLVVTTKFGVAGYALTGLIPLAIGAVSMIGRRVIAMFNFTLAESDRGLRIVRGLTNLTSQSVPVDRIQGLKISQPLLWRRFGWFRVDVDILGYGSSSGENNESDATSVLLPVATLDQVQLALREVLPGVDLDAVPLHRSSPKARWFFWFTAKTLRWGWDDSVLITEHGLLTRVRNVVPHAKTQSVRIEQGPIQRKLGLADVHVDTPKGPVDAVARELEEADARELAMGQLDRARAARGRDRERLAERASTRSQRAYERQQRRGEDAVLARFQITGEAFLGSGGESRVFTLGPDHVLRLYHAGETSSAPIAHQLRGLYDFWSSADAGFETPQILEIGEHEGRDFTVDRRLSGIPFTTWLADTTDVELRRTGLLSYLDLASSVYRLPVPVAGFARLVGQDAPQQFDTLAALLAAQLEPQLEASRDRLVEDLPDVESTWNRLHSDLARRVSQPYVVHGDICPPNVFVSRGPDGAPVVTGLADFSPHTLTADPLMDITGAIVFLELEAYAGAHEDAEWLTEQAVARFGEGIREWVGVYRRFYAFYFASSHAFDDHLYRWCLAQLRTPGSESEPLDEAVSQAQDEPGSEDRLEG